MRKEMLNNIVTNCVNYDIFKKWYFDCSFNNPVRDKLYLEAAHYSNYKDKAKKLILNKLEWSDEINQRIIEFVGSLK